MTEHSVDLVAHRVGGPLMPLRPAPRARTWMEATSERFAYRCLPLLVANQAGWVLESAHTVLATWDGGAKKASLEVTVLSGPDPSPCASHFGHGILTWTVPYLFRTSPGWQLLLRGPANWPKDGAAALEGIVETDWSPATATMNWKLTRPGLTVRFDVGEPIGMIVPMQVSALEAVQPRSRDLSEDEDLAQAHEDWAGSRRDFLVGLASSGPETDRGWQRDYFHGRSPGGIEAPTHARKLRLREVSVAQPPSDAVPE